MIPSHISPQETLLAIFQKTSAFVCVTDLEYQHFQYLNAGGRKMLGIDPGEPVAGLNPASFLPAWAFERIRSEGIPTALRENEWIGETAFTSRNGVTTVVSQSITAHRSPGGNGAFCPPSQGTLPRVRTPRKPCAGARKCFGSSPKTPAN